MYVINQSVMFSMFDYDESQLNEGAGGEGQEHAKDMLSSLMICTIC